VIPLASLVPLQVIALTLVAAAAAGVVLLRDPLRQLIFNGAYGLLLVVLFVVFQAPDVALSMLVVASAAYPVVVLSAIARVRQRERAEDENEE
jgi:uncharacterized MnhB-related membrane protein